MRRKLTVHTRKQDEMKRQNDRLSFVYITRPWLISYQTTIDLCGSEVKAFSDRRRKNEECIIKFSSRQPTGWCGWDCDKWRWIVESRKNRPIRKGYKVKKRAKFWLKDKLKKINK